jgi:hypothetical protein
MGGGTHAHETIAVETAPAKPDDLTELEGVGPKVAKVLEVLALPPSRRRKRSMRPVTNI